MIDPENSSRLIMYKSRDEGGVYVPLRNFEQSTVK